MHTKCSLGSGLLISLLSSLSWAQPAAPTQSSPVAEEATPFTEPAPTPATAATLARPQASPANPDVPLPAGMLLQARIQSQVNLLSLLTSTSGFLVGYQFRGFALGAGVGLTRATFSADHTSTQTSAIEGTIWHFAPKVLIDVWHSTDRRTRANAVASIGFGKGSFSYDSESCKISVADLRTCAANDRRNASAFLIPIQVGFGGDHFLSRNFALGVETGFQYAFTTTIKMNGRDLH